MAALGGTFAVHGIWFKLAVDKDVNVGMASRAALWLYGGDKEQLDSAGAAHAHAARLTRR